MPRKYTPPEQALKQYNEYPSSTPLLFEVDSDGNDIEKYINIKDIYMDMSDSNYIEWSSKPEDMYKDLIPTNKQFVYELTITFDRKIHTYPSMLNIDNHLRIIKYYIEETLNNEIVWWYYVKEYHKTPIGPLKRLPPHYHMIIQTEEEIQHCSLWNLNKAFNRHFGMNTFRPIEDIEKYAKYMCKDVEKNVRTYLQPHLFKIL